MRPFLYFRTRRKRIDGKYQKRLAEEDIKKDRRWPSYLYLVDYGWPKGKCIQWNLRPISDQLYPQCWNYWNCLYFSYLKNIYSVTPKPLHRAIRIQEWSLKFICVLRGPPISLNLTNFIHVPKTLVDFKGLLSIFCMGKNSGFLWHNL